MRNNRVWLCLLFVCFLALTVVCVGCTKTPEDPDHSKTPPTASTTDLDYETDLIIPDDDDIIVSTTSTLGYTTGTGVDSSTAHVTVTTDDGTVVTDAKGEPATSFVSTTTTTTTEATVTTTISTDETTTSSSKNEVVLPFVPFD